MFKDLHVIGELQMQRLRGTVGKSEEGTPASDKLQIFSPLPSSLTTSLPLLFWDKVSAYSLSLRSPSAFQLAIVLPRFPESLDDRRAVCYHTPFGTTFNIIKADALGCRKQQDGGDITCYERLPRSSEKPKIINSECWCNFTLGSVIRFRGWTKKVLSQNPACTIQTELAKIIIIVITITIMKLW